MEYLEDSCPRSVFTALESPVLGPRPSSLDSFNHTPLGRASQPDRLESRQHVGAGGVRSGRSPAPAVILLEAAERHCRSSADLQAGPRPPGRRLTALELAYLQVFRSPWEDTGLHLRPHIFDFSEKAVRQHWAHISTWAQMSGAK